MCVAIHRLLDYYAAMRPDQPAIEAVNVGVRFDIRMQHIQSNIRNSNISNGTILV